MKTEIDEGLYSRQLYVLGHKAMSKMSSAHVLISGMGGLGLEIAKNIILAGISKVCIHDTKNIQILDLSSQYYSGTLGENRAEACCARLSELNNNVSVYSNTQELNDVMLTKFSMVVLTDNSEMTTTVNHIDQFCRSHSILFILANTYGLFGQIFCDFGDYFTVFDTNGVVPRSSIVTCIDENGIVLVHDDHPIDFDDDTFVSFSEVKGMPAINTHSPFPMRVISNLSFSIGDTTSFGEYEGGGIVKAVKMPVVMSFDPLAISINNCSSEYSSIHLCFRALELFVQKCNRLPLIRDEKDGLLFVSLVESFNLPFDKSFVTKFSSYCAGSLCPMDAIIGSLCAQEVIKGSTGKFSPIKQWLYFDALSCIPKNNKPVSYLPDSRYMGQSMILGQEVQDKLLSLSTFIVGMGAIGCELLKNFAMMGVSCGTGTTWITDMDRIERSNLNRQFLFKPGDIMQPKSTTAAQAIKALNGDMNIVAYELEVGNKTDMFFNDYFYQALDVVFTALDRLDSRKFVDGKCVYYQLPFVDSGTHGTKGHCQPVIPHVTESYSSSNDPVTADFPFCTVRHFPNTIEHCIQYAVDFFKGFFYNEAEVARKYKSDPEYPSILSDEVVSSLKSIFGAEGCVDIRGCVLWAYKQFSHDFTNTILQLLHNFPSDALTTQGYPFWSAPKRCPRPIYFDITNPGHVQYVTLAAQLRAQSLGISGDVSDVLQILSQFQIVTFEPSTDVQIPVVDEDISPYPVKVSWSDLETSLVVDKDKINGSPLEYDKDDDMHAEFVTLVGNLRAENYGIECTSVYQARLVSGKIVPAMATTTSLVVGLVCLELYKIVQEMKDVDSYTSTFADMAVNQLLLCSPVECGVFKYDRFSWTLWDRIEISERMTLCELLGHLRDEYKVKADIVSQGDLTLFSFFMEKNKKRDRLAMEITQVVKAVIKEDIPNHVHFIVLDLICSALEGSDDVMFPFIKYKVQF